MICAIATILSGRVACPLWMLCFFAVVPKWATPPIVATDLFVIQPHEVCTPTKPACRTRQQAKVSPESHTCYLPYHSHNAVLLTWFIVLFDGNLSTHTKDVTLLIHAKAKGNKTAHRFQTSTSPSCALTLTYGAHGECCWHDSMIADQTMSLDKLTFQMRPPHSFPLRFATSSHRSKQYSWSMMQ